MSDRQLVLVTGGSSGIGKEIARQYLLQGSRVVLVADGLAKLEEAARELSTISHEVAAVPCDVGDPDSVVRMSEQVLRLYGCPDILVNNAGFATYRLFEETDPAELERLISVNFTGHLRCARAFLPAMVRRRSGVIVNVASIAGRVPMAPNGLYSAAKHGLVAWSETLRHEVSRHGLQVVVVCPGRVETAFFDHETFRARRAGPETHQVSTAAEVARVTVRAVERRDFMTYMPKRLGPLLWASGLLPPLTRALLGVLIRRRVDEIAARRLDAREQPREPLAS